MSYGRDANRAPTQSPPTVAITPPGNDTNAFVLIHVDWLTGRARGETGVQMKPTLTSVAVGRVTRAPVP